MGDTAEIVRAEQVIATLRAHEAELRSAGIIGVSLFGSVARGDAAAGSDVDLVVTLDRTRGLGLIEIVGLEEQLADMVGRSVDLVTEPIRKERLRHNIDRDRVHVF